MSSEDEHIDQTDGHGQLRFGHPPNVRVSSLKREQPNVNQLKLYGLLLPLQPSFNIWTEGHGYRLVHRSVRLPVCLSVVHLQ